MNSYLIFLDIRQIIHATKPGLRVRIGMSNKVERLDLYQVLAINRPISQTQKKGQTRKFRNTYGWFVTT